MRCKIIKLGRGQAILLPEWLHIDATEVSLKPTREGILVMLRHPWVLFFEGAGELSDAFLANRRRQPRLEKRRTQDDS
jgi:hypothetical protein